MNGGSAGPSDGGKAARHRTTSPSGRVRERASISLSSEPASRSRARSASAPSVATAYETRPDVPGVKGLGDRARDGPIRGQGAVEEADELDIGVAEPGQPVVRAPQRVPAAAGALDARGPFQLGSGGFRVRDRNDQVIETEEHRASLPSRRVTRTMSGDGFRR